MIFIRAGSPSAKPDPNLAKTIYKLLEQEKRESELCPTCENDHPGRYNPVCQYCDDFGNYIRKEN